MLFKLGGLIDMSFVDTDGVAFSLFFQGCNRRCKGCHNPEFLSFDGGELVSTDEILRKIEENLPLYNAVAYLGGEPLEQKEALLEIMRGVRELGLDNWLYTGYTYDEVPTSIKEMADVIVEGEYREDLPTNTFPASSNQQVIDRRKAI